MSLPPRLVASILVYSDLTTARRLLIIFPQLQTASWIWNDNLFIQDARAKRELDFDDFVALTDRYAYHLFKEGRRIFDGTVVSLLLYPETIWVLDAYGSVYSTSTESIVWIQSDIPHRVLKIRTRSAFSTLAITETGESFVLGVMNQYRQDQGKVERDLYTVEAGTIKAGDNVIKVKNVPVGNSIQTIALTEETYERGESPYPLSLDALKGPYSLRGAIELPSIQQRISYPEVEALQTTPIDVGPAGLESTEFSITPFQTEETQDLVSEFEGDEYFGEEAYDL